MRGNGVIYLARKGKPCDVGSLQWWQQAFPGGVDDSKAFNEGQVPALCKPNCITWAGCRRWHGMLRIYLSSVPFFKDSAALRCNPTPAVGGWCKRKKVLRALLVPTTGLCKDLLEIEFKWAFEENPLALLNVVGVGLLFNFLSKIHHHSTYFCEP